MSVATRSPRSYGFTLIELSIAMVVVAILLGSLAGPLVSHLRQRSIDETRRAMEQVRESLLGFAMANGRLPRPAASALDGSERPADCITNADCTGHLPWAALGSPRADAWGKLYRYSVTKAFANSGGSPITLSTSGVKRIMTRTGGSEIILADQVAAVVISHGPDHWGVGIDGSTYSDGSSTNVDEDANATHDGQVSEPFYARTSAVPIGAAGGEFDDLVAWIPQSILASRLIAAGHLP